MLMLAAVIGFMGPFGTYAESDLLHRSTRWLILLMGAYVLVRPAIALLDRLARTTGLPKTPLVFWGVTICSAPLAAIWRFTGENEFRHLDGYAGLVPFSLLCSLTVLAVVHWSVATDLRLMRRARADIAASPLSDCPPSSAEAAPPLQGDCDDALSLPAMAKRLSTRFKGPIVALQSEDHYVRVHGSGDSELVLMRLRDAIAEMENVSGEQVHRSWWVAREAIKRIEPSGRSFELQLENGMKVPVARDSIARLKRSQFLSSAHD